MNKDLEKFIHLAINAADIFSRKIRNSYSDFVPSTSYNIDKKYDLDLFMRGTGTYIVYLIDNGYSKEEIIKEILVYTKGDKISLEQAGIIINTVIHRSSKKEDLSSIEKFASILKDVTNEQPFNFNTEKPIERNCYLCSSILSNKFYKISLYPSTDKKIKAYSEISKELIDVNVCEVCYRNRLETCKIHGFKFKRGFGACVLFPNCTSGDRCVCEDCSDRHIHDWHKKISNHSWTAKNKYVSKKDGKICTAPIKTGVEFEVVGLSNNLDKKVLLSMPKGVGVGKDDSLQGFASPMEIQTPPATGAWLENIINKTCSNLRNSGYGVNYRCGLHAHIDVRGILGDWDSNDSKYKNLLAAYLAFENLFMGIIPAHRRNNRYAYALRNSILPLARNNWNSFSTKQLYFSETSLNEIQLRINQKRDTRKYSWCSFHSMYRGFGIEIRNLEGTLDSNLVLNWINLHHKFINSVVNSGIDFKQLIDTDNIIRYYSSPVPQNRFKVRESDWEYLFTKAMELIFTGDGAIESFLRKRYNQCKNTSTVNMVIDGHVNFNSDYSSASARLDRLLSTDPNNQPEISQEHTLESSLPYIDYPATMPNRNRIATSIVDEQQLYPFQTLIQNRILDELD